MHLTHLLSNYYKWDLYTILFETPNSFMSESVKKYAGTGTSTVIIRAKGKDMVR